MAPPAVPRPAKDEPGPRRISTCSVKKFSRTLTPASRMPSRKTSLRASKPRMKKRSPKALPPSPVPSVTPAVYSTACFNVVAFLSSRTSLVSTVIVFGVFSIGSRKLARCLQRSTLYGAAGWHRDRDRPQAAGIRKRHCRHLRRLRAARGAAQCGAGTDLSAVGFDAPDAGARPAHRRSPAAGADCCASAPENERPRSGRQPPIPSCRNGCRTFLDRIDRHDRNAATSVLLLCPLRAPDFNSSPRAS